MSQRASPTLIGAFVIGALALLIAGMLVLGSGRLGGDRETLVLYFRHSTSGLRIGAPVVLKGVQIGVVTDIGVTYDEKDGVFLVPVHIEIDQDKVDWPGEIRDELDSVELYTTALKAGLRARLSTQSLVTGMLQIEIGFFPGTKLVLYGGDSRYRELPTIRSSFARLQGEVENIPVEHLVQQAMETLEGLNKLVNAPEVTRILTSLQRAADDLAKTSGKVRGLVGATGERLDATLGDVQQVTGLLADRLDGLLQGLQQAAKAVQGAADKTGAEIGPTALSLRGAGGSAEAAFVSAKGTFDGVSAAVGKHAPLQREVLTAVRSLTAAARSVQELADYLERHPEALLRGKR